MANWALEHPWMTFFLLAMVIISLDNLHVNIAKLRIAKYENKKEDTQ